jgi:hypothetical protein
MVEGTDQFTNKFIPVLNVPLAPYISAKCIITGEGVGDEDSEGKGEREREGEGDGDGDGDGDGNICVELSPGGLTYNLFEEYSSQSAFLEKESTNAHEG